MPKVHITGEGIAYSHREAIEHFGNTGSATSLPFIYLSAGSSDQVFCEMLELATEAGVKYSGVLCGRATWQDAIPIYATAGVAALEGWLADRGRQNIQALNDVLARGATAWWNAYGGKDNLEVIEPSNPSH
jgi:tagatose 1,6-diphosphate aldolase